MNVGVIPIPIFIPSGGAMAGPISPYALAVLCVLAVAIAVMVVSMLLVEYNMWRASDVVFRVGIVLVVVGVCAGVGMFVVAAAMGKL